MTTDDHFLARWARRKAEVAKAEAQTSAIPDNAAKSYDGAAPDEPPFDLTSLPSLEMITAETDIRPFMNALVPADLRNAALRRMWELDTAIRDYVSPATEYAWNWHEGGNAPGYGPLEAGFKAAEAAVRMFSEQNTNNTLVESPVARPNSQAFAIASEPSASETEATQLQPETVAMQTVRLSTKHDTIEQVGEAKAQAHGAGDESSGGDEAPIVHAALRKSAARHGRATPR